MSSDACPSGHLYDENNTYVDGRGYKHCRTCRRDRMRERRAHLPKVGPGSFNAAKTHCPRGHEYTEENTTWTKSQTARSGYSRSCRACARENTLRQNVKRYGLTPDQLVEMLDGQDWRCLICDVEFDREVRQAFHIDHDHDCCPSGGSCGKCVRGLLCADCNHGLGRFRDSAEALRRAADYVERYRSKD